MALATPSSRDSLTAKGSDDDPDAPIKFGDRGRDREANDRAADSTVLDPGEYIDRYRILEVVGTGGVGVVYAAADEALGRKVAIKLLRPSTRSSTKFDRRRARLVREAQALARLSHPNVVPVYEVGTLEDQVFLAMEFIEGHTMRRWLRRSQRSPAEILDKYIQAGRGLAAAHAADIVHRDFKPDNVLVGHDGRVRVLDFGLATPVPDAIATGRYPTIEEQQLALERTGRRPRPEKRSRPPSRPHSLTETAASLITAHGKVMGTPAYMSPEQSRGEPIDARADQYSFCIALWEALYGERPHGPLSATSRLRSRRVSERGTDIPQSVQRALERGLSMDPVDRFPDMDSLLTALERRPTNWRRASLLAAAPLAVALAVITGIAGPTRAEPCPRDPSALAGVWDPQVREHARRQLTSSDRLYASATWDTVEQRLDRWTERWLDTRVEACEATKVQHEQSPMLFDLRMACLDRQAIALRAVTEGLASGSLEAALAAVLELPDPARCDRTTLAGAAKLDDMQLDAALEQRRRELARVHGLLEIARYDEALALVDHVLAELAGKSSSGADMLLAEATLARGRIVVGLGDGLGRESAAGAGSLAEADRTLRAAVFAAQAAGHDEVTVQACTVLIDLLVSQARLDDAGDWAQLGHATLARIGGDPQLEAGLRRASARLARERGAFEDALVESLRVLELGEQHYGAEHVELARILGELALTRQQLGHFDAAEADLTRALSILTVELGYTHPEYGLALIQHGSLLHARKAHRDALSKYLDALAIFELAYPTNHPTLATLYADIARVYLALGESGDARSAFGRAHSMLAALRGPEHPETAAVAAELEALRR